MKIHTDFDHCGEIKNAVITTGTFDGVHIGHKIILDRLNFLAKSVNGESVLITFHPHPRKILFPDKCGDLKLINSQEEKKQLLAKTGLDHLFIIPFTLEFSKTTSHTFVNDILLKKLHARIIIVGFNHHFGHNREGDYSYLHKLSKTHNFDVEEIPMKDIEHEAVSSTRIRKALQEGHIQRTNAYLDHYYNIQGETIECNDFPGNTDNKVYEILIEEEEKLIPPVGSYAISVNQENHHGLSIILSQHSEKPRVYILGIDENLTFDTNKRNNIFYHKKISTNYQMNQAKQIETQILEDINEINELIF
ncbi:MAG: FAD synthetase family protein [Bacteroidales bacterium]|jgi:riboflavin kinase/FMN adenylyltransferase|nr:FAD synthetase family protein [Bacteroidales bacterium]